ncbi:MAG TPA: type II toxin-antitoxin system RelE/ParE family toxin [Pyrinomonadaceae bacterium]|nr:type II toxin-antitoxin system RelE/ParE family toxin [Pyrinomonadaceae bacterium]
MNPYRLLSDVASDADLEAAFEWYESEQEGLGAEFLREVRAAYNRILDGPFKYQELRSGIRRALTRRFPYAIYFTVEDDVILVIAVLDTARDPAEWQFRI